MESLTLVKTAAPSAIPRSTVSARPGCFRMLRRVNQTKNFKKKDMRCTADIVFTLDLSVPGSGFRVQRLQQMDTAYNFTPIESNLIEKV